MGNKGTVEQISLDIRADRRRNESWPVYLTTEEAAAYLRKSQSWLLKRDDIPFLKGVPNLYRREDLDDWFERHMQRRRIA